MEKICALYTIFVVSFFSSCAFALDENLGTLELVHVFVRHGARYPKSKETYPNDPHKFEEHQMGQLNKVGKSNSYKLGKYLRERYGNFLGNLYEHGIIDTVSTDQPRTKMTALLLLAGLFPPSQAEKWNDEFPNWQPVPYNYTKREDDTWFLKPSIYCPKYHEELKKLEESDDVKQSLAVHSQTLNYIKNHSGKKVNDLKKAFKLFQGLSAEESLNLTLPTWTQTIYPDFLLNLTLQRAHLHNTGILKRLRGGRIMTKVIRHIYHKIHKLLHHSNRKMYLYSLHEHNLAAILASMNILKDFPKYSSAIIIELHSSAKKKENFVKVLFLRDLKEEIEVKCVGNCTAMCPLHEFVEIMRPNLPINYTEECRALKPLDEEGIVLPLNLMNTPK